MKCTTKKCKGKSKRMRILRATRGTASVYHDGHYWWCGSARSTRKLANKDFQKEFAIRPKGIKVLTKVKKIGSSYRLCFKD